VVDVGGGGVVEVVVDVVDEVVLVVVEVVLVEVVFDVVLDVVVEVDVVGVEVVPATQLLPWQVPVPPPVSVQGAPGVKVETHAPSRQSTWWHRLAARQSVASRH
jgi:hypothetical protein